MNLEEATALANEIVALLAPHCDRIQIAGSIRRQHPFPGDIEIVCIPKYDIVRSRQFVELVDSWEKVRGDARTGKATQRIYKQQKVDIFMCGPENWGYIFAIRTGSAGFSHLTLARRWVQCGLRGIEGQLVRVKDNTPISVREEEDLFKLLNLPFVEPRLRYSKEEKINNNKTKIKDESKQRKQTSNGGSNKPTNRNPTNDRVGSMADSNLSLFEQEIIKDIEKQIFKPIDITREAFNITQHIQHLTKHIPDFLRIEKELVHKVLTAYLGREPLPFDFERVIVFSIEGMAIGTSIISHAGVQLGTIKREYPKPESLDYTITFISKDK